MASRYDLSRDDVAALLGGPAYRTEQMWHGLYKEFAEPTELTVLSKALRDELGSAAQLSPALTTAVESTTDDDNTVKWLFELHDGKQVETVLMHYDDRSTVCVSSQAGCAMNCSFCATGQAGYDRQLGVGEVVEQVVRAARRSREDGRRLSNIVFMGMGEPMANYDTVWAAVERIHNDIGIGARHITVSTVGIVPGILRLSRETLPVGLAVSLHAANDTLRNSLVPINKKYPLSVLMEACETYIGAHNRRLSFEWALIGDVNDRQSDAEELAGLALPLGAHINLIPLNPTPGYAVRGSSRNAVHRFSEYLGDLGANVTIRDTRGVDIDAACGQLAAKHSTRAERQAVALKKRA